MAIVYNIFYYIMWSKYLDDVEELQNKSEQASGFEVFENMFYLYNLVLHGPTCLVNMAIIIKELQLEKWGLVTSNTAGDSKHAQ